MRTFSAPVHPSFVGGLHISTMTKSKDKNNNANSRLITTQLTFREGPQITGRGGNTGGVCVVGSRLAKVHPRW